MDPGLIKLLEDDEDENTLPVSGAAVDAFAAELNRDVIGGTTSTESGEASYGPNRVSNGSFSSMSQAAPPISTGTPDKGSSGQGKSGDSSTAPSTQPQPQSLQWQNLTPQQQELLRQRKRVHQQQQQQQQQQQRPHPVGDSGSGSSATAGANSEKKQSGISYGISFSQLMPLLHPHLPPEQGQQLTALFLRFKAQEISREDFVRGCRAIAGDQMLVQTIRQMQLKARAAGNQMQQAQQIRQQKSLQQSGASLPSSEQNQQSPHQDQGKVKQLPEQDSNPVQATPLQQSSTAADVPPSNQPDSKSQSLVRQTHQQLQQVKAEPQTLQSPSQPLQAPSPTTQLQSAHTDQQQGPGQLPQSGAPPDTAKSDADKQLKQQHSTAAGNPLPVAIRHPLTAPVVASTSSPQVPQILKVGQQAQPLQSQLSAGGSDKPLSKYQKQKQRKQKQKEEEELRLKLQGGVVSPSQSQGSSVQQHQGLSAAQSQLQTPSKQAAVQSALPVKQEPEQVDSQKRQASQSNNYLDILPNQGVARPVSDSGAMGSADLKDSQKGSLSDQDHVSSPGCYNPRMAGSSAPPAPTPMACAFSQETSYAAAVIAHSAFPASSKGSQPPAGVMANRTNATGLAGLAMQSKQSTPVSSGLAGPTAGAVHMQGVTPSQSIAGASGHANTLALKTPMKKPITGQKKAVEGALVSQPPSKKQKVVGGDADQSIDQLNDVTAVSGVNLREEEEQLLAGPKEESRTTDAVRKLVRDEEDRLFLEKGVLRPKISDIAKNRGVSIVNDEVERCLSMAAEEVLRSMMYRLIKLSKQRCDSEKDKHKVVVTSDARKHLLMVRKTEKAALEKKQAEESERLRKMSEKKDKGALADAEKEELRAKALKAQQEEEDKMRTNAANMAARAAVGVDDMLSKWQLLAEQGRQKRQGGETGDGSGAAREQERRIDVGQAGSGIGPGRPERNGGSNAPTSRTPGPGSGSAQIRGRPPVQGTRPQRSITLKDIIACLEREPNLAKSTLLYRLYERDSKTSSDVADKPGQGVRR